MFKNLNCKKFKFADDGNLLVTEDAETQVYLNCQIILKQLERLCKNWRIAVNGDKMSIIYLNTENARPEVFWRGLQGRQKHKNPGFDCGQQTEFQRTSTAGRRESC